MPKDDDGMLDKLDGRVERVERVEGFSRKERKGRKELNHEIHGIHGNGRARWSHRNPLSSVIRCNPLSFVLRRQSFPLPREERRLTLLSYYCVTLTVSEGSDPKNIEPWSYQ